MTVYTDSQHDGVHGAETVKPQMSNGLVSMAAFAGSAGLLVALPASLSLCTGVAVLFSLSLTFSCLLNEHPTDARSIAQMDIVYAALAGVLFAIAKLVVVGSLSMVGLSALFAVIALFAVLLVGELVAGVAVAALMSRIAAKVSVPVGVALAIHGRLFGRAGRLI